MSEYFEISLRFINRSGALSEKSYCYKISKKLLQKFCFQQKSEYWDKFLYDIKFNIEAITSSGELKDYHDSYVIATDIKELRTDSDFHEIITIKNVERYDYARPMQSGQFIDYITAMDFKNKIFLNKGYKNEVKFKKHFQSVWENKDLKFTCDEHITKSNLEKENKIMMNKSALEKYFGKFGRVDDIELSMEGLAFTNIHGRKFVAKINDNDDNIDYKDVTEFTFGTIPCYAVPVEMKTLQRGDIINYNNSYLMVLGIINGNTLYCFNITEGMALDISIPKNLFGSIMVSKIINPLSSFAATNDNTQMNMMLPLMLIDKESTNSKSDLLPLLMMSNMNGTNVNGMNPMMLAMLMDR